MSFYDWKAKRRSAEIIERYPRMAERQFRAALANRIIGKCWAYMFYGTHMMDRHCAAHGIFGDARDRLDAKLDREFKEYTDATA